KVLDLVQGDVEPCRQSGGGGAQHGQVGTLGGHLDLHVIGCVAAVPDGTLGGGLTGHGRGGSGVFCHVSPSVISPGRPWTPATECNLPSTTDAPDVRLAPIIKPREKAKVRAGKRSTNAAGPQRPCGKAAQRE